MTDRNFKFKIKYKPRADKGALHPGDIIENFRDFLYSQNENGEHIQARVIEIWNVKSNVKLEELSYAALVASDTYQGASGCYKILVETIDGRPLSEFMSGSQQAREIRRVYADKVPTKGDEAGSEAQ